MDAMGFKIKLVPLHQLLTAAINLMYIRLHVK